MNPLLFIAGLSYLVIDDYYVLPEINGRELTIKVDEFDGSLRLAEYLTDFPVAWSSLSEEELQRIQMHLHFKYELQLPQNMN
jgi:hypothetical protein